MNELSVPSFALEQALSNLGGVDARPFYPIDYGTKDRDELKFPIWERVSRALELGEAALGAEMGNPAFFAMLEALQPKNPLIRRWDYAAPDGPVEYPTLGKCVGERFDIPNASRRMLVTLAERAHGAVEEWYEILLGSRPTAAHGYWQETPDDWQRISSRLNAHTLPTLFTWQAKRSGWKEGKNPSKGVREKIHFQQTMLPYALLTMAFRAFPGNADEFSDRIGDDIGYAKTCIEYADLDIPTDPPEFSIEAEVATAHGYFDSQSFSSPEAKQAYLSTMGMLGRLFSPCEDKGNDSRFSLDFGPHSLISHIMHLKTGGSAFAKLTDRDIINVALQSTLELGEKIGATQERLLVLCNKYLKPFTDRLDRLDRQGESTALSGFSVVADQFMAERAGFLVQLQAALQAQALVDGVMEGTFSANQLDETVRLANEKPMQALVDRIREVERLYDEWEVLWVIAQPSEGSGGSREVRQVAQAVGKHATRLAVDQSREDRLIEYVAAWQGGRGVIVRSKLPDLPKDEQYLVALLPRVLSDGRVVWNGIADNKHNPGRHAALIWLAEAGMDVHDRIRTTWDIAFRLKKKNMKAAGMRRLLHCAGFSKNLLMTLATPPDKIPRYGDMGTIMLKTQLLAESQETRTLNEFDDEMPV